MSFKSQIKGRPFTGGFYPQTRRQKTTKSQAAPKTPPKSEQEAEKDNSFRFDIPTTHGSQQTGSVWSQGVTSISLSCSGIQNSLCSPAQTWKGKELIVDSRFCTGGTLLSQGGKE